MKRKRPSSTVPSRAFVKRRRIKAAPLMRRLSTEPKYFDSLLDSTAFVAAANWAGTELDTVGQLSIFQPILGNTVSTRIGNKVVLKKLAGRFKITLAAAATQAAELAPTIRLVLYLDKQPNGAQSLGADVMTGRTTGTLAVTTFQNIANFGRFRVLMDKTISFTTPNTFNDAATTASVLGYSKTFKFSIRFKKPLVFKYNAVGGGTVADSVVNALHIVGNADNIQMAPVLGYNIRAYYEDV